MFVVPRVPGRLAAAALVVAALSVARPAQAQAAPGAVGKRALIVAGVEVEPRVEDLLGLGRLKFHGVIAGELSGAGYRVVAGGTTGGESDAEAPLTLVGSVVEEICDDEAPSQCRVAIRWELQDRRGVVVYRATTRAVDQVASLDELRRRLILGTLTSLLQRRRFALQLNTSVEVPQQEMGPLGIKRCGRAAMPLPGAARAAAASLVLVEAGSNLTSGTIVSGDGLVLTNARALDERAPLRVRFSAQQTLPAKIVALDRQADVALLHVAAHTEATCLAFREAPLAPGMPIFGVGSELAEERATSIMGGLLQRTEGPESRSVVRVDPLIARAEGGPLLDDEGRLVAVVLGPQAQTAHEAARALTGPSALRALGLKQAPITDPRLFQPEAQDAGSPGYVRDRDDPPFVLTERFTYGTSLAAHRLRTAGLVTLGVGAAGVVGSWFSYRATRDPSPAQHSRFVVLNDVGWALFGLGAVGFGISYALPEAHDVVAVQVARRALFFGFDARGIEVGANL